MSDRLIRLLMTAPLLACAALAHAVTDWNAEDYQLYTGDFNGDGRKDVLYIASDPGSSSGIALSDGLMPNVPWQSWPSNYLGIQWYGRQYTGVVADFNNDGRSDLLMQRVTPGDSFLMLADANGRLTGISQTLGYSHVGLTWSNDQHTLLAGDFSGDGPKDLFFQAAESGGVHGIPLADINGLFTSSPTQTFTDRSWPIFKWSRRNAVISSGDFNCDARADLLVQTKPNVMFVDYDILVPVSLEVPNSFGVVYSQGGATPLQSSGVQLWNRRHNGVDWSPLRSVAVIGDFNGDGCDDVLLQARSKGQASYLLTGNASGPAFSAPAAISSNVDLSADSVRLIAANFGSSTAAGLYVQSAAPGQASYVAQTVGSSISAQEHDSSALHGVETVSYSYDARGRLIRVQRSGATNEDVRTQYTYDNANNRRSVVISGSANAAPPSDN